MELLLGLLFLVLLLACSIPPVLLLFTFFAFTDLPVWLEGSVTSVLGLGGGFVVQAFVIDLLNGERSWKDLRKANTGMMGAFWLVGAAGAPRGHQERRSHHRLPLGKELRQGLFALVWAAAAMGVGMVVAPPDLRKVLLPQRRPPKVWLWRVVDVGAGIVLFFAPAVLLILIQEGRFSMEGSLNWTHIALILVGAGPACVFDYWVQRRVKRLYGVTLWDS